MSDHGNDKRREPTGAEIDPDAPPSAEEVLAAERLRDALEGGAPSAAAGAEQADLELLSSLRAAWSPDALDARAHAELLDDMPMSAEEIAAASALRDALEGKSDAPEVVAALRTAWSPAALDEAEHRAIVAKALGADARADGRGNVVALRPRPPAMRLAVVTTTTVLALAASVVVWLTSAPPGRDEGRDEAPLAKARSTQPLFDEPFKAGETSARIDRIAVARASDYRDNRFAKWGVR